jgi:hypothetical protein
MAFNPEDAPRYLEGVDYPANKEALISAAESNGAPDELVEMIGTLGFSQRGIDTSEHSEGDILVMANGSWFRTFRSAVCRLQ